MIVLKLFGGVCAGIMVLGGGFMTVLSKPPVLAAAGYSCNGTVGPNGYKLDAEGTTNAGITIATTQSQGLPQRAAVIAIATSLQETGGTLHNINHGDAVGPDSRGLFQQRASWGPLSVRMDPAGATKLFLARLVKVPAWDRLPLGIVAQAVQISGDPLGSWYAKHEAEATAIVASYKVVDCSQAPTTGPGGDTSCCAAPTYAVHPLFPWVPPGGFPTGSYSAENCTWWAAYNHRVPSWAPNGDGWQWWGNALAAGIATSHAPSVGAVVVYDRNMGYSSHGHVALVKGVRPDASFVVSEMNYQGLDIISERVDKPANPAILGFIAG